MQCSRKPPSRLAIRPAAGAIARPVILPQFVRLLPLEARLAAIQSVIRGDAVRAGVLQGVSVLSSQRPRCLHGKTACAS